MLPMRDKTVIWKHSSGHKVNETLAGNGTPYRHQLQHGKVWDHSIQGKVSFYKLGTSPYGYALAAKAICICPLLTSLTPYRIPKVSDACMHPHTSRAYSQCPV